ncbi:hypothetical protein WMY93_007103 [Mugilogobius chulae]|uniref:Small integral membrane protein 26 n=1 Tax=Mugilogobius chulae TaxID=88201 RepID=A0AAW0Q1T2_9GOBI
MDPKNVLRWNKGASAVYALGIWTMVGSYFYFKYTGKCDDLPGEVCTTPVKEKNPNEVVYETAHMKSVIVYKKDFVPYRIRIMNFIESFNNGTASGDKDDGK